MKALFMILLLLTSFRFSALAQWTERQSFNTVKEVHNFGAKKLCVCNYCAFILNENFEIQYLNKTSGLSSANISASCADEDGKYFAIAYKNGSLDICSNGKLFTIQDITFGSNLNNRNINHLTCSGDFIVASLEIGVSLIDVKKQEVSAVCFFGETIKKSTIYQNKIFSQTSYHIYSVNINDVNIQDPERWKISDDFSWVFPSDIPVDSYNNLVNNQLKSDSIYHIAQSDGKIALSSEYFSEVSGSTINNIINSDNQNFTCAFYNPYNSNHIFLGSENGMLYEYLNHQLKSQYANSYYLTDKILDMNCTPEGDLFILMNGQVSVFDHNGNWHIATSFDPLKYLSVNKILKISDYVFWISTGSAGIFAVDLNSTPTDFSDDKTVLFYPKNSGGERIGNKVTALSLDNNGRVWIGTNKGVATISNPESVFTDNYFFVKPIITETSEHDGDYSQYLLSSKYITAIECDSKHRKWISTLNSGVFVVNESGSEEEFHFNESNSGLPGDSVFMMKYIPKTGEVYIKTNCGLASYLTDTQETQENLSSVKVFPNPVRPDFDGEICISGLEENCDIRITDIAGNLVYKTVSEGGKIFWDGINQNGHRCSTGVYLIFISSLNTKNTTVKKLLMVK